MGDALAGRCRSRRVCSRSAYCSRSQSAGSGRPTPDCGRAGIPGKLDDASVSVVGLPAAGMVTAAPRQFLSHFFVTHGAENYRRYVQLQQHDSDRALKRVVFPILVISVVMLWAVMVMAVMSEF